MPQLIEPTLDLLLYDLRESYTHDDTKNQRNLERFKERLKLNKIPADIIARIDEFDKKGDCVDLFGQERDHEFTEGNDYKGYFHPVKLHDSFSLTIDCYYKQSLSVEHLNKLADLKQIVENKIQGVEAEIGQTWFFYATVKEVTPNEYDTIAQNCYQTLMPTANWQKDKPGTGEFSGGKLFELWQESGEKSHVIIVLFDNEKTEKDLMQNYFIPNRWYWFLYRHKITWAYTNSSELEQRLRAEAVETDRLFNAFDQKSPDFFEKTSKVLRSYSKGLSQFEIQIHTIEENLHNYQERMCTLREEPKGLNFADKDKFEQKIRETYLPHLQRERVVFRSQLELIKNLTALAQARETGDSVKEIASMQRKVEWVEVFFASYYAAALTYYIFHGKASSITIAGLAIVGGLVVLLLLKPWEHWDHSSMEYRFLGGIITAIAVVGWSFAGNLFFKNLSSWLSY